MAIAIAAIRRAASSLRESNEEVGVSGLARALGRPLEEVRKYIRGVDGLADEIGLVRVRSEQVGGDLYLTAVALLRDQKISVTVASLARHMNMNLGVVSGYLHRNPDFKAQLGIVSQGTASFEKARMKLSELVAELEERGEKTSMSKAAEYCGLGRSAFHRFCKKNPPLKEIIRPYLKERWGR